MAVAAIPAADAAAIPAVAAGAIPAADAGAIPEETPAADAGAIPAATPAADAGAIPAVVAQLHPPGPDRSMTTPTGAPRRSSAGPGRTRLTVVAGDLTFSNTPVIVGHLRGDALLGHEMRLDEALDGALKLRYALGTYPEAVGSAAVVRRGAGVGSRVGVVIGLGDIAEFTASAIRSAVFAGLVELALAQGPEAAGDGVSIVRIGGHASGMGLAEGLAATLQAVVDARERLRERGLPGFPLVQIIDHQEDEAHAIWHVLRRLARPAGFDLQPEVDYQPGVGRRIVATGDAEGWRAIQIEAARLDGGGPGLRFTVTGGAASAESYVTSIDPNFLRSFINSAVRGAAPDGAGVSPARALYEMIWPDALKQDRSQDRDLRLILDETAAALPLELLDDRQAGSEATGARLAPPALRHGLLRQLVRQDIASRRPVSLDRPTALVIGDPRGGPPAADFSPLPGARQEAKEIADALGKAGYAVTALIGDEVTPAQVVAHVLRGGWTILHAAGHGVYEYAFRSDREAAAAAKTDPGDLPRYTGMVLGDRIVLSPATLQSLPNPPALAFINCCDLGEIDPADEAELRDERRPQFAAGFAAELIALGAQAVIASGWVLQDFPSLAFAKTFYKALLQDGLGYGDSVKAARQAAYASDPAGVTWGAYQCYGEPDWQPSFARGGRRRRRADPIFASPNEAVASLASLTSLANVGAGRAGRRKRLRDELATIEKVVRRSGWLARPPVTEALGWAFAAIDETDRAIDLFEQTLSLPAQTGDPGPSLHLVQALANLRIDQAVGLEPDEARSRIVDGRRMLEQLCEVAGDSAERCSLIGSAYKREAEVTAGEARDTALGLMAESYRRAWDISHQNTEANPYYPGQMVVTARTLARLRTGQPITPEDEGDLSQFLADVDAAVGDTDDYARHAARAAHRLLRHLAEGQTTDEAKTEVQGLYATAHERSGTDQQFERTLKNMDFVAAMLEEADPAKASADWVRAIREALTPGPPAK